MKLTISKQLNLVMFCITVSSIIPMTILPIGNVAFWWLIYALIIIVFVNIIIKVNAVSRSGNNFIFIKLLLVWYLICIFRGFYIADNYWEWKNLVGTSFAMLIPIVAFIAADVKLVSLLTQKYLKYALPFFFLFFPFIIGDGVGRYLVPISILLLFLSVLDLKWKLILLGLSLFVFFGDIGARSNIIKFGVPLMLGLGVYTGIFKFRKFTKFIYISLMCLPFLLFFLAQSGAFNIFKLDDILGENVVMQKGEEVNLTVDTRTLIYEEVIFSSIKHDYFLFGRTPARGAESALFGEEIANLTGITTNERFANEVSILNIFTWTGLIGVLLYFLCFAKGAFLAIFKSNNQFARLLGLYISFRWCYAWVEDFNNFDLSYLYLWILIGLCYSNQFRLMNEKQVIYWVKGIFHIKYRKYLERYNNLLKVNKSAKNNILASRI